MSRTSSPTTETSARPASPETPEPAPVAGPKGRPRGEWVSKDGKRAFFWKDVTGRDYHPSATQGMPDVLYLYLNGGILRLAGAEANEVLKELTK